MKKSIGAMRHRLSIQEAIMVTDSGGGVQTTWQNIANNPNIFADIISIRSTEKIEFSQVSHKVTHKITIRYRDDLTLDKRLNDGTDQFNLEKIEDNSGNKNFMTCYAVKI